MEYRRRNNPLDLSETAMVYEDNIVHWYDAITDKIQKNRELKSMVQTFYRNLNIIAVVPLKEDSETLLSRLSFKEKYLPVIERMTENRKREWLSVRVLLKELLGEEKEILYNSAGKPYLSDNSFHISISHTKGYAALIINKENEVAIDIEKIAPRVENIRKRFVNEEEEKTLSKSNEVIHLLLYWSAKESLYKRLDVDNVDFKTQLHIQLFEPVLGEWSDFEAYETRTNKQNCFKIKYFVHEDYVLTYI